jgi:glycine/D-amino acid oxidase-like deaminating enzyme
VGRWAGLDLPLEISREQEIMVRVKPGMPLPKTAVSNMVDRIYFRPTREQGTLLVGVGHPKDNESADPDNYNRKADAEFAKDTVERLTRRLPHMVGADLIASWAGLYTITPDWNMIADQAAGVDGLFLAVGGSGHSFKLAPALGECMAELIASGESNTVDITPLRASRFEEGGGMLSTYGGNRG